MFLINRISSSVCITRLSTVKLLLNNINNSVQIHSSSVLHEKTKDCINLQISGINLKFPYVWLRDNCQCEHCFHSSARSRTIDWSNFNLDIKPKQISQDEKNVVVTWEDGHKSVYVLNWLKLRSFSLDNQKIYAENIYRPNKITWAGQNFSDICSQHNYNEILKCDQAFHNWLEKLSKYGVALIKKTPNKENAVDDIVKKIGFSKQTHYGIKYVVQNVKNTSNVAYLSSKLQMHTDLPYYEYCPGVNMLHCLVQTQSDGGENLLSDSHFVAHYIRDHHPDQYKLLTDIEVEWSDVGIEDGNEFYKLYRSPVICLDKHGNILRINFSIPQRGTYIPTELEMIKPWYEAHALFYNLSYTFAAKFKSEPGDLLTFDNIRLLHGRNAYEDTNNNMRRLIGVYVDWDEIYSRLRCLKVKLKVI